MLCSGVGFGGSFYRACCLVSIRKAVGRVVLASSCRTVLISSGQAQGGSQQSLCVLPRAGGKFDFTEHKPRLGTRLGHGSL